MAKKKETTKQAPKTEASETRTAMGILVEEVLATQELANADLEFTDYRTRPGREIAKREAQDRLAELKAKHMDLVKRGLAGIFVYGDDKAVKDFTTLAEATGGTFTVDGGALYRKLAEEVESSMRTDRFFEPTQFARLLGAMAAVGREMELDSLPALRYGDGVVLPTFEDVVGHVRYLVRNAAGDVLNAMYLHRLIAERALAIRYLQNVVPVVVTGTTEQEHEGLSTHFNRKTVMVTVESGKVDDELVLRVFDELKQKITNKS